MSSTKKIVEMPHNCEINSCEVILSGMEVIIRGGQGNKILHRQQPVFICDEASQGKCNEYNCRFYPKN